MKKMKVLLSVLLVLCVMVCIAPLRGQAQAALEPGKWYQVTFTPVQIEMTSTAAATTSNGTATAAGTTTRLVPTSYSYYFNEWAKTLIIRGTGEMPAFDQTHPAPWANLKDKATRVIFERNITTVSSYAFVDFSQLKSIVLPMTLKSIDPRAFIWSDEVRQLPKFVPLDRIEFSGDMDKLQTIIDTCGIQDLKDARLVKVTEKAIADEIYRLTWFRVPIARIERDKAGRPVRIVRVDEKGYTYDTMIQYVDESALNVKSDVQPISIDAVDSSGAVVTDLTRDVVEKRQTLSTFPDGERAYYEKERNDLGQQTYFAAYGLDEHDRKINGEQYYSGETGVYKSGLMKAVYAANGAGTMTWNNTYWDESGKAEAYEQVIEEILASGRVASVSTTTTAVDGTVLGTSTTTNSYDTKTGRLASSTTDGNTTTYSYDAAGRLASTSSSDGTKESYSYNSDGTLASMKRTGSDPKTITYTYDKKGLKTGMTEIAGSDSATTSFNKKERADSETVVIGGVTYQYEYKYKDNVVSERIVKDVSGNVIGNDTFNASGYLVQSIRKAGSTTTTMAYQYDSMGKLIKTTGVRTVEFASADPASVITNEGVSSNFYDRSDILTNLAVPVTASTSVKPKLSLMSMSSKLSNFAIDPETLDLENKESIEIWSEEVDELTGETSQIQLLGNATGVSFKKSVVNPAGDRTIYEDEFISNEGEASFNERTKLDANGNVSKVKIDETDLDGINTNTEQIYGQNNQMMNELITVKDSDNQVLEKTSTSNLGDSIKVSKLDGANNILGSDIIAKDELSEEEIEDPAVPLSDANEKGLTEVNEEVKDDVPEVKEEPKDDVPEVNEEPKDEVPEVNEEPKDEVPDVKEEPKDEVPKVKEEPKDEDPEVKEEPKDEVPDVKEEPKDEVPEVKEEPAPVVEQPKEEPAPVVEQPKEEPTPAVEQPKEESTPAVEQPKEESTPAVEQPKEEPSKPLCSHCGKVLELDEDHNCKACGFHHDIA